MTKPTSARAMAGQNLLVAAVNTALMRRLIALECELATQASFEFTLDGHPVIAYVNDAGFDEVSVHVTCRPTKLGRDSIRCVILHGWREYGEVIPQSLRLAVEHRGMERGQHPSG